MIIENAFEVAVPPDQALEILTDVPRIAPCLPGVMLTEVRDDGTYAGTAMVRLGPVSLSFKGEARIEHVDKEAQTARVTAKGADQKGRGQASADVTFNILPAGDHSEIKVKTDLSLTGAVAQYGRASGLIEVVANQIIADFTDKLEAELDAGKTVQVEEEAVLPVGSKAADAQPETRGNDLSGLSFFWRALLTWFRSLFGRA